MIKRKIRNVLTETQKQEIKQRYITEFTSQKELAKEYLVSIRTIANIVKNLYRYDVSGLITFQSSGKEYGYYENDDFWRRDSKVSLDRLGQIGKNDKYELEDDEFWHGSVEDDYSEEAFP